EIYVAFIREDLDEIVAVSSNIPEVHVEYLLPRPEIADHLIDLLAGIGQHFRNCALAEVQPMIRALADADKLFDALHGAQNRVDALIAFRRNTGIVRVAGDADLVLVGDGANAI